MNASSNVQSSAFERAVGAFLGIGLALGAVVTLVSFVQGAVPSAAAQTEDPLPLGGQWRTFGNGDRINDIVKDGDVVWSATDGGGLVRWNLIDGTYRQFLAPQDGLLSNIVNDIVLADGKLWLATDHGLSRFDTTSYAVSNYTQADYPDLPARKATAVELDGSGGLWVGYTQEYDHELDNPRTREKGAFQKGGFAHFDPISGTVDHVAHVGTVGGGLGGPSGEYVSIPSENITAIHVASNGNVWVGTAPYYEWDDTYCPAGQTCGSEGGAYVLVGGGLAMYNPSDNKWSNWSPGQDTSCYSNHIADFAEDAEGRVWVGTLGRGLHMMPPSGRGGGCTGGQVYFTQPRSSDYTGLKGNHVYAVGIDEQDRVWAATSERGDRGAGVSVLDHNNTFGSPRQPWAPENQDDLWIYYDVDNAADNHDPIVSAFDVRDPAMRMMGTIDVRNGDGYGLRRLQEVGPEWTAYATAKTGLPSNLITYVTTNPENGDLWVGTQHRGVARWDGEHWTNWKAFQPGEQKTTISTDVAAGFGRLPVDFADKSDCDAAFVGNPRYARIGDDPTLYEVRRCLNAPTGRFMDVQPDLAQPVRQGTPVYAVDRGPASNTVSQITFDGEGNVWAGGRETIFLTGPNGSHCPTFPECWLDGGISKFDGTSWQVYNITNSDIPDQEVAAVIVDPRGKVWAGTGNPRDPYADGIGVLDPATDTWTIYKDRVVKTYQAWITGVADYDLDPVTNQLYVAMHAATACAASSPFGGGECSSETRRGGGVGRFDGATWQFWTKTGGANLKLYGDAYNKKEGGEAYAVKVDRGRRLVWVGGWDGVPKHIHWGRGEGFDAAVNWCAIPEEAQPTATPGTPAQPTITNTPPKAYPTATPTADAGAADCEQFGWQNKVWPEEGQVNAIDLDSDGRLWAGVHRNGQGVVPPVAGVKLLDGGKWYAVVPDNSGMPSNEVTSLAATENGMWVGTLTNGIAYYLDEIPPTPTPSATNTATASATATAIERTPTSTTPGTPGGPTPGTPTRTRTPGLNETPPTPTATGIIQGGCEGDRCPYLMFAPIVMQSRPRVTPAPRSATPTKTRTLTPSATRPGPSDTPTLTPSVSPTTGPTSPFSSPTPSPSATQAVATNTPQPTTPVATATATSTAKPTIPPVKNWVIYDNPNRQLNQNASYQAVFGTDKNHVWIVGTEGLIYFYDGTQFYSQVAPSLASGDTLRNGQFLDDSRGFIVGDGGTLIETRNGGQNWRTVNPDNQTDDWGAIAMFKDGGTVTGWAMGMNKGNRVYYDGGQWNSSPTDRNTRHHYADAAMLSASRAYAIRDDSAGARMYVWDGTGWGAGPSTGVMHDMDMEGADWGLAVGDRGSVWEFDGGDWLRMGNTPSTTGRDLFAVHVMPNNRAWAGGERTIMFYYDGQSWDQPQLIQGRNRNINSIWIDPTGSEGWAVGDDGLVLRYR